MSAQDPLGLIEQGQSMISNLIGRGMEADSIRQLPSTTINELIENNFFSIVAPKRCGGFEYDLDILLAVVKQLGQGCGSTAWVTSLLGTHNWLAGLFSAKAQDELFADKNYLLAPAVFAPTGKAVKVNGGYRVSGCWSFASGISHSNWIMLSALLYDKAGENAEENANVVGMECVVIPIGDITVKDTWDTVGMRGTGSHDIEVDNVFVPQHRSIPFADVLSGNSPGAILSDNPIYRIPLVPYLSYTAAAPALGIGFGALEQFRTNMVDRVMLGGEQQQQKVASQIRLGEAQIALSAAEALMDRGVRDLLTKVKAGHTFSIEERVNYRAEACYVADSVKRVVDNLLEAAGAKAQFHAHPLQRFQRDINNLRGHVVFDMDSTMEMQGRSMIGLAPNHALI